MSNLLDQHRINDGLKKVQIAESLIGLIGNVLVCVTIQKTKALHNLTNYLLLNLAAVDASVCVMGILEGTMSNVFRSRIGVYGYCTPDFVYNFNSYFMFKFFEKVMFTNSVLSLTLATFERYIGIIHPLQYVKFITRGRIATMICFVWLAPILIEIPETLSFMVHYAADDCAVPTNTKYPEIGILGAIRIVVSFVIPCIALAFMYINIMINLKRGARHLDDQGIHGPPQELQRAHRKITQALVLVVAVFFILIMPGKILRTINIYGDMFGGDYMFAEIIQSIVSICLSMNSTVNPVVYGFKYTKLRRACFAMMCPCARCNRSNRVAMEVQVVAG